MQVINCNPSRVKSTTRPTSSMSLKRISNGRNCTGSEIFRRFLRRASCFGSLDNAATSPPVRHRCMLKADSRARSMYFSKDKGDSQLLNRRTMELVEKSSLRVPHECTAVSRNEISL